MAFWQKRGVLVWFLFPVSCVFDFLTRCRYYLYRHGWWQVVKLPVPVIVVGNITVGGTGKTPLVIALAEALKAAGLRVGIISRGYKSLSKQYPYLVTDASSVALAGDEPFLMYHSLKIPVVIDPNRCRAARKLLTVSTCDVIISDDGLQHYRLGRDIEIAVVDGERRFGNQFCLPAGPLRENLWRLSTVDFVVGNGKAHLNEILMTLVPGCIYQLNNQENQKPFSDFIGKKVYAVAGIGYPRRYFSMLEKAGIILEETKSYGDHHHFTGDEFTFPSALPILITEKDAVKCTEFQEKNVWVVPVAAQLPDSFLKGLIELLKRDVC